MVMEYTTIPVESSMKATTSKVRKVASAQLYFLMGRGSREPGRTQVHKALERFFTTTEMFSKGSSDNPRNTEPALTSGRTLHFIKENLRMTPCRENVE